MRTAKIWKWMPTSAPPPRDFKWVLIASEMLETNEAAEAWLHAEAKDRGHEIDEDGISRNDGGLWNASGNFLYEYDYTGW